MPDYPDTRPLSGSPAFDSSDSLEFSYGELGRRPSRAEVAEPLPSVTEQSNPLTENLDVANAEGIVRLLRQVDAQTINGFSDHVAIADRQMLALLSETADRILKTLEKPGPSVVVFSGAGTSGRLAMTSAALLNRLLKHRARGPLAVATMAGGDSAFLLAKENAEDSPAQGLHDLDMALGSAKNVVFIGVTCGLSAAYVMAQVDQLRDRPDTLVILLGFTPPETARAKAIAGWSKTCADVVRDLANDPRHVLITPVVGPEAVTGSTRLKGATATAILIQMLTICGLGRGGQLKPDEAAALGFENGRTGEPARMLDTMRKMLRIYEDTRTVTYLQSDHLAAMIDRAGDAIRRDRHIVYLGEQSYGLLALMDAAECVPTFGADPKTVRGFCVPSWEAAMHAPPPAPSQGQPADLYDVDADAAARWIQTHCRQGDLVIGIGEGSLHETTLRLLANARERGASTAAIVPMHDAKAARVDVDVFVPIDLSRAGLTPNDRCFAEIAVKTALNCVSTGGFTLAGKVVNNRMIDLRLTNSKLFDRARRLVMDITGARPEAAMAALMSAIHDTDSPGPDLMSAPVAVHCAAAAKRAKVVPTAILMATGEFTLAGAREALNADPVVRNILAPMRRR